MKTLSNRISICLRKKFSNNNTINANQILDESYLNSLIQHDDGYRILEKLPTSPAYWQKEGQKLRAMIRQIGIPNFFITLSSAETKWIELLKILKKTSSGIDMSDDEVLNLSFSEKSKLIRNDPVTCARYFDHRIKAVMKVIKNKNGIFGEHFCKDYYWRIEVQNRGSLHLHGLFWLNNFPIFDPKNTINLHKIIELIDMYSTTDVDLIDNEDFIQL